MEERKRERKKKRKIDRQLEADVWANPKSMGMRGMLSFCPRGGSVLIGRIIREFLRERAALIKIVNESFLPVFLSRWKFYFGGVKKGYVRGNDFSRRENGFN